jgi:hypothetical protein
METVVYHDENGDVHQSNFDGERSASAFIEVVGNGALMDA